MDAFEYDREKRVGQGDECERVRGRDREKKREREEREKGIAKERQWKDREMLSRRLKCTLR